MVVVTVPTGSLKSFATSQISEQAPAIETLELFWFNSNSVNVNLPPAFIQALQITTEDEVTAKIVATKDGRKGILILPNHSKNRGQREISQNAIDQDYGE